MNRIVQRITSDSQEVKQTTDVIKHDKATPRQLYPNTLSHLNTAKKEEPNLRPEKAYVSQTGSVPNPGFDSIRFRRGNDIVKMKNQIRELDRFQYRVKSQSNCEEYEVISTELGWICSCSDHKFRGVICKHIYAILCIVNREQAEACNQDVIQ